MTQPNLADEVVQQAEAANVRLIRCYYTDNGGIIRGKVTYITGLRSRLADGIGLTVAMQAMNMLDQLAPVEGMGPVGEVRLVPDPATYRALPYAPRTAGMTTDMIRLDGQPWEACPRSFLKRQIAAAADLGISLQMAAEFEWSMAHKLPDGTYTPVDDALCFASTGMTMSNDVIMDIVEALEAQRIPVELYYPELGHGQQEMSIRHAGPLEAADRHIFVRETIRNVAYQHGMYASLAPKPFLDQAGNGGHIHFSLWDRAEKRNLMYEASGPYQMSTLGLSFIAGILDHLPGLLALTCPTYNSYHRLQPHFWSSAYTAWGPDNREGAVRVASSYRSDEEGSTNAELKAADLSVNPYLAYGALIAAGLDGVRRELDPGEPVLIDPANYSDEEREQRGIRRFPASLNEALDALEGDTMLTGALGPLLATSYMAVKRLEYQSFSQQDKAFEVQQHFWKF
ncbi:MAG: glutamine synthetase family protein [Anaerolineae bacterium]|nr:glutamine synthetase family protein [Anaerolineae bacterium]